MMNSTLVRYHPLISLGLNDRLNEDGKEESVEKKKEVRKVDEETLRKRMETDKEIKTLREEKDRIVNKLEKLKNKKVDDKQLEEEALQLIQ